MKTFVKLLSTISIFSFLLFIRRKENLKNDVYISMK
ncbi:hypothetical protein IG3_01294 [Bacillus cereus HuA2-1]|uniref:Uncharacterized protein n=1 Tax=Bacillus cereus HuA2-1 TaxID=1053201 RepID=J9CR98_BACCE|nr:hypothetical protein IG3_01294 [Bacillus cereus HuA2-1]